MKNTDDRETGTSADEEYAFEKTEDDGECGYEMADSRAYLSAVATIL
jgi:hypothetical protein